MKKKGQLHSPAALSPQKDPRVPNEEEVGHGRICEASYDWKISCS